MADQAEIGGTVKLRAIALSLLLVVMGGAVGWIANSYWSQETRRAESMLALNEANIAAKKGDLDTALQYATQSYVLYPDSPLAGMMVNELREKRAKLGACAPQ
jgi:hypothetical protein